MSIRAARFWRPSCSPEQALNPAQRGQRDTQVLWPHRGLGTLLVRLPKNRMRAHLGYLDPPLRWRNECTPTLVSNGLWS